MNSITSQVASVQPLQGQQLENAWERANGATHPNEELLHHTKYWFKDQNPGQRWTDWVTEKIRGVILEAAKVRDQASVDVFAENNYDKLTPEELVSLYHLLNSHKKDGNKADMLGRGALAETLVISLESYITECMALERPADAEVLAQFLGANPQAKTHHLLPKLQASLSRHQRMVDHPALAPQEEQGKKELNEDVLAGQIFSYVQEGRVRLVCKAWKAAFDTYIPSLIKSRMRHAELLPNPIPEGKLNYQSIFSTFLSNLQNFGIRQEKPEEMAALELRKSRYDGSSALRLFRLSKTELEELNQANKDAALIRFCEVLPDDVKNDLLDENEQPIFNDATLSVSGKAILLRQALEKSTVVQQITELDLNSKGLLVLPPEIGKFTALTHLNLSINQIKEFPPEIGQLIKLEELNLYGNGLERVPNEIFQLKALKTLGLNTNKIKEFPPEIGKLTALTYLNLSSNQLERLPPEIGKLTALTYLNLVDNQIKELPSEVGQLTKLENLGLDGNQLERLPDEFFELPALSLLQLSKNNFREFPCKTGGLPALTFLNLYNNPLKEHPSAELLARRSHGLRIYYFPIQ